MTAVVGIAQGGHVWIGADAAGTAGWSQTIRSDVKVFRNGPMVMGFTTSYRMGQLLRYALEVPKRHSDIPVDTYMVTTFIDAVRACLKAGGYAARKDETEIGGCFLVGFEGRLFMIGSDYQVGESAHGYDATGCGDELALGSLFTSKGTPKERIIWALTAAEEFSAGVRGPFTIVDA